MAQTLVFNLAGLGGSVSFALSKVDRSKLYGSVVVEAFDEKGERCELLSLANDGRTLFGKGGFAYATVSQDGDLKNKDELIQISLDCEPLEPVESSFTKPIELIEKTTIEDYLSHLVKSVYRLLPVENLELLVEYLKNGDIYKFPFSYRAGITVDTAFLLLSDENVPFMIVCEPARIRYLTFNDNAGFEDEEETGDDDQELTFDFL